ncbi:hypothetical protein [aff. Roholtiella sp. LEGE 12411]|nr:hypothetical protein [aff. Roholtiella sp. LEGE 12411]MBE9036053.1 hypothetical protein [aff. Roholtiella sp. LEGE 12411]
MTATIARPKSKKSAAHSKQESPSKPPQGYSRHSRRLGGDGELRDY